MSSKRHSKKKKKREDEILYRKIRNFKAHVSNRL